MTEYKSQKPTLQEKIHAILESHWVLFQPPAYFDISTDRIASEIASELKGYRDTLE